MRVRGGRDEARNGCGRQASSLQTPDVGRIGGQDPCPSLQHRWWSDSTREKPRDRRLHVGVGGAPLSGTCMCVYTIRHTPMSISIHLHPVVTRPGCKRGIKRGQARVHACVCMYKHTLLPCDMPGTTGACLTKYTDKAGTYTYEGIQVSPVRAASGGSWPCPRPSPGSGSARPPPPR